MLYKLLLISTKDLNKFLYKSSLIMWYLMATFVHIFVFVHIHTLARLLCQRSCDSVCVYVDVKTVQTVLRLIAGCHSVGLSVI